MAKFKKLAMLLTAMLASLSICVAVGCDEGSDGSSSGNSSNSSTESSSTESSSTESSSTAPVNALAGTYTWIQGSETVATIVANADYTYAMNMEMENPDVSGMVARMTYTGTYVKVSEDTTANTAVVTATVEAASVKLFLNEVDVSEDATYEELMTNLQSMVSQGVGQTIDLNLDLNEMTASEVQTTPATKQIEVTYIIRDPNAMPGTPATIETATLEEDAEITYVPTAPSGYTFVGWQWMNDDGDMFPAAIVFDQSGEGTMTLFAVFEAAAAEPTELEVGETTFTDINDYVVYKISAPGTYTIATTGSIMVVEATYDNFEGKYAPATYEALTTITVTDDPVYVAVNPNAMPPVSGTVTLTKDGGSVASGIAVTYIIRDPNAMPGTPATIETATLEEDAEITYVPTAPSGYTFVGWQWMNDDGDMFPAAVVFDQSGEGTMTLFAVFEAAAAEPTELEVGETTFTDINGYVVYKISAPGTYTIATTGSIMVVEATYDNFEGKYAPAAYEALTTITVTDDPVYVAVNPNAMPPVSGTVTLTLVTE